MYQMESKHYNNKNPFLKIHERVTIERNWANGKQDLCIIS